MGKMIFKETHIEYDMEYNKKVKIFKCSICGSIATKHIAVKETMNRYDGADYCDQHYKEKIKELEDDKNV